MVDFVDIIMFMGSKVNVVIMVRFSGCVLL